MLNLSTEHSIMIFRLLMCSIAVATSSLDLLHRLDIFLNTHSHKRKSHRLVIDVLSVMTDWYHVIYRCVRCYSEYQVQVMELVRYP
jgi:hypothetical protein